MLAVATTAPVSPSTVTKGIEHDQRYNNPPAGPFRSALSDIFNGHTYNETVRTRDIAHPEELQELRKYAIEQMRNGLNHGSFKYETTTRAAEHHGITEPDDVAEIRKVEMIFAGNQIRVGKYTLEQAVQTHGVSNANDLVDLHQAVMAHAKSQVHEYTMTLAEIALINGLTRQSDLDELDGAAYSAVKNAVNRGRTVASAIAALGISRQDHLDDLSTWALGEASADAYHAVFDTPPESYGITDPAGLEAVRAARLRGAIAEIRAGGSVAEIARDFDITGSAEQKELFRAACDREGSSQVRSS